MKKILIIAAGVLLAFGLAFFLNVFSFNKNVPKKPSEKPKPVQTAFNFLLLGYGGGAHEGTYLTDTMMVVHVDIKSKKATLISIPRDLWVRLPTKSDEEFHRKINAVYQIELFPQNYPGLDKRYLGTEEDAKLVKTIVAQVTGLKVDGYVSVNFEGFTKAVDILGGIDVDIARSFTDDEYPIEGKETDLCGQEELFKKAEPFLSPTATESGSREDKFREDPKIEEFVKNATSSPYLAFPCRYEKLEFTKGITHLDGKTALKYARTRRSGTDGGDFNRAHRQQQIIEAFKDKVLSLGFISKIIPLMDQFKQDVKTDIGLDLIRKFIGEADNTNQYKSTSYVISDENLLKNAISSDNQYILIPKEGEDNWSGINKALNNLILGITPTPIASPSAALSK